MAVGTDIQIESRIQKNVYDDWAAYAIVTTAKSRGGRGITVADECKMMAVAYAIAGRIEAERARQFAASLPRFGMSTPEVGLHGYGNSAYVRLDPHQGKKEEAEHHVEEIDKAIKAFKLSDIGL